MYFKNFLLSALLLLALSPFQVFAGPGGDVNLVNFTPYDWNLTYSHSYQMTWQPPAIIPAGANYKQYVEYSKWPDDGDCAAEAIYELVGSPVAASFTMQARQTHGKRIQIQYNNDLTSLGSPENSLIDLGFDWDGAVLFLLSGDGTTPYISSNPPAAWMQASLPTIGDKTLREISMPLSHDSGMSEIKHGPWLGVWRNTCTQTATVLQQLQYGARWFDIRPFLRDGKWFTGHFSSSTPNDSHFVGGAGRSIDDIVQDINNFASQNPGEFIVLELTHEIIHDKSKPIEHHWNISFSDSNWLDLYDKLAGINQLWTPSNDIFNSLPSDLTSVPMSTFIQPGSKSAVIIRIPDNAPAAKGDKAKAFIHENRLVWTGSYSDTNDPAYLERDQLAKLVSDRPSRDHPPHRSTYTITQNVAQVLDAANWKTSIVGQSYRAHRVLLGDLWDHLSRDTYPNLIEIDNLHNSQVAAMCMAINDRYADGKRLGGELVTRTTTRATRAIEG